MPEISPGNDVRVMLMSVVDLPPSPVAPRKTFVGMIVGEEGLSFSEKIDAEAKKVELLRAEAQEEGGRELPERLWVRSADTEKTTTSKAPIFNETLWLNIDSLNSAEITLRVVDASVQKISTAGIEDTKTTAEGNIAVRDLRS